MKRAEVLRELNRLIIQNCPKELEIIDFIGKSIIEDLGFDSVSLMQLVTDIEETFGVSMDESDSLLGLLENYDELVEYVTEKSGGCYE